MLHHGNSGFRPYSRRTLETMTVTGTLQNLLKRRRTRRVRPPPEHPLRPRKQRLPTKALQRHPLP
jgi:hypothetical protein